MSLALGLVAASLVIFLSVAACVAVMSRMLYSATPGWLGKLAPAARANCLLAWAAAPLLVGLVTLVFIFSPSMAHLIGLSADHCHAHGHHAHLCVAHTMLLTGSSLERMILGGIAVIVLGRAFSAWIRLRPAQRALRMLLDLGKRSSGAPCYYIVPSAHPFALTAGLTRPEVLVSSRLFDKLKPSELATVLSHEWAHQRRRDALRLFAADLLCELHLPVTRRFIQQHLRLAVEQACDEAAARQSGDRLHVAEVILKVMRMARTANPLPFVGPSFTGSNASLMVEGLLRPELAPRPWLGAGSFVLIGLLIAAGLVTGDWWHHSAEALFGFYLG
jgi:Zn-dependent protease with chaperone function